MNLAEVTPLIITFNESPNIKRCLERLTWANEVVIIDSGSTDQTLEICAAYPNSRIFHRQFDSFANQCNFGLAQVRTEWVLSLDADYILEPEMPAEIQKLAGTAAGYEACFRYCIFGHPLRATLYPARTVLYQVKNARYIDIGHGHRVCVEGVVSRLQSRLLHDDRKSLERWLDSQRKYVQREANHLMEGKRLQFSDRIRKWIWPAPLLVFLYTLFYKGCLFDGWRGWYYVLQRTYAELLLSLELLDRRLRSRTDANAEAPTSESKR